MRDDDRVASTDRRPPDGGTPGWLQTVAAEARALDRSSTAERVADVLRRRITEGDLPPGTRLSEEQLVDALRVSRNTLREAFRLLSHEGLLVHQLHRGVFVPTLSQEDLVDLYRLRRTLECEVVRTLSDLTPTRLAPLHGDVGAGEAAAETGDWVAVGTANMLFHSHLVGLAGSRQIDEVTARVLAELRLVFAVVADPQSLHEPYLGRNRVLLELLDAGEVEQAAKELETYLHDSETLLLSAYGSRGA